ncbi:D-2-hydroxyacid dehydrogenase [Starkeya koreensis]|uniref:D-2-hydroxyacid dehydrogenase n=1 Tax=Ancylobacter koreensis TaxID=266121 RepID=A0ABT0DK19_9HYPH|nr:D-2-hydroxyacid dehydrogenase [Ancylobacter koreensis]MCK0207422.1 D-2-hydroxyacid dehydrogenase [Ancylobacter koreensis]
MSHHTPVVVFLDRETLPPEIILPRLDFEHEWRSYDSTTDAEVAGRIAGADIVVTNKVRLPAHVIEGADRLKCVAVAATGYDVVDLAACRARGIVVSNIRNYAINTVPEHTFALILALRRSLLAYRGSVARGRWIETNQFSYFDYPVHDLSGAVLGILGDGVIGQAVAAIGRAFGMIPLYASYKGVEGMGPLYTPFEEVLRRADILTLHAPLTPATRNMIGPAEFALMECRPLIINTARGGLVDEEALADALESGRIAGAGFDVATVEPPPREHVMMRLLAHDNFILTPHVAWSSREAIQSLADQLVENINLFWRGAPRNVVT